ncbi:WD40/YVTN/BNR-like repeat-containing protein [Falsibacillus albus]|uniref:Sortilin N-terminal domain-containing protein n=1 Tax=Falsibacillus albus TaxID=2478915 RepID=A0A3L7JR73_9BACI|nr:hypothetical protein [Falsibacillus albus]RLQ93337.1 hypothetical protein D9X91_17905 [Falsibacillus albus]
MKAIKKGWLFLFLSIILIFAAGCSHHAGKPVSSGDDSEQGTVANQDSSGTNKDDGKTSVTDSDSKNDTDQSTGTSNSSDKGSDDQSSGTADSSRGASDDQSSSGSSDAPDKNVSMEKITSVRMIDADSGWIGGDGWIARSDNNGKNWSIQYEGEQTAQQIFALNGKQAWVVFADEQDSPTQKRILKTDDGGKHWMTVGRMPQDGFLHFRSTNDAFVGNAHSEDGGKTWVKLNVPSNIIGEPYFHDAKNGWAVTLKDKQIQVMNTTDGGNSWNPVFSKKFMYGLNGAIIRSAGAQDAWVELIGGTGMTQTSYSFFHTKNGGATWLPVVAKSTAGGGPAPGVPEKHPNIPDNKGSKPGPLYVVNTETAFLGGTCPACDQPNTMGWTNDGGKSWHTSDAAFSGFNEPLLAMADDHHGWWITNDNENSSVLYTTKNGGTDWEEVHTFEKTSDN